MNVFGYIEAGYGIFHCEGDEAVLEDIDEFLARKGIDVYKEEIRKILVPDFTVL